MSENYQLRCHRSTVEGQCYLLRVQTLRFNRCKYIFFIILCILTLGIFYLFTRWYKKIPRCFYYDPSSVQQATDVLIENNDQTVELLPLQKKELFIGSQQGSAQVIYFQHRYLKYRILGYDVQVLTFQNKRRLDLATQNYGFGWTEQQAQKLRGTFGQGAIIIKKPTYCQLFATEILRPLYIFLFYTVVVQIIEVYYIYAGIIFFVALAGIILSVIEISDAYNRISEIAYSQVQLNVLRNGQVTNISSNQIVPGDIVFVPGSVLLPFDGILLSGNMLINQAALTGESVPVQKKQYRQNDSSDFYQLYSGTTVLQVNTSKIKIFKGYGNIGAPVYVTSTNYVTLKGRLIRKILFPEQLQNRLQRQAYYFLFFMLMVCLVAFLIALTRLADKIDAHQLIMKFFDLISICVPPTLPISLSIGVLIAVENLKTKRIFTIAPTKLINGGLLDCLCFDKTGTLTEDYMELIQLRPAERGDFLPALPRDAQKGTSYSYMKKAFANLSANHSVVQLETTKQLIGDPMEIDLIKWGKVSFTKNEDNRIAFGFANSQYNYQGKVYKIFQFDSKCQRTSAIGYDSLQGSFMVYSKGSPEAMYSIMKNLTVPNNYWQILKQYTSQGYRVLAYGSKLTTLYATNQERATIQTDIEFDGFYVFKNKLKPQTKSAIQQLIQVEIHPVMITGDNPVTACQIAYEASFLQQHKSTIIVSNTGVTYSIQHFQQRQQEHDWQNRQKHKSYNNINKQQLVSHVNQTIRYDKDAHICMTGPVYLQIFAPYLQEQAVVDEQMKAMFRKVRIFARAKPQDKAGIVKLYQKLGFIVGMCGDGANDCQALSQANIGLSLSQSEASVAAAFTAKDLHIGSMVQLIIQARGALVINTSLFDIVASYALIQFTSTLISFFYYTYPSQANFMFWDFGLNVIPVILLTSIPTATKLSLQKPMGYLLSFRNLTLMVIFFLLQAAGQIVSVLSLNLMYKQQLNYGVAAGQQFNLDLYMKEGQTQLPTQTLQMSVLFMVSCIFLVASIFTFTFTVPWKQRMYKAIIFTIYLILITLVCLSFFLLSQGFIAELFKTDFIKNFKVRIFLLGDAGGLSLFAAVLISCFIEPFFRKRQLALQKQS